ncbi:PepSY domain-containing protein [Bradyrhizobium sp. ISRA464]|nr:PepSY domain-containing protein [Bradyrhizobium sp. ISRA463]WGS27483.1 PepSY domain-containing protein [Bradyrhizobium sp. ISRA464]
MRKGVSLLRFVVDVHNTAGFWASIALPVISITGVGIIFPDAVRPVVGLLSQATPDPSPPAAAAASATGAQATVT